MAVVVTGATGYLGGELVSSLRSKCIDVQTVSRTEIEETMQVLDNSLVRGGDPVVNLGGQDSTGNTVFHFAGLDRRSCNENPGRALRVNSSGTYKVLRDYIAQGAEKIIWLSTAGTIRDKEREILDCCLEDSYVKSKRLGEALVNIIRLRPGQSIHIVRLANVFGTSVYPINRGVTLVGNCFCKQAAETNAILIKSDLEKRLSFVPLQSFLQRCELLLFDKSDKGGISQWNLSGDTMSLLDFASTVRERAKRISGRNVDIFHGEERVTYLAKKREVSQSMVNEIDNSLRLAYLSSAAR